MLNKDEEYIRCNIEMSGKRDRVRKKARMTKRKKKKNKLRIATWNVRS